MKQEITANRAAAALGISLKAVQARITDGRLKGRQNRVTRRMWTTPDACVALIRAECGAGSTEESAFLHRLRDLAL